MSTTFYTKRYDTKPLQAILKDSSGTVVNLTGATVVFTMKGPVGNESLKVNRQSVTVTDATGGVVSYSFTSDQTATAGTYRGEFEVTNISGVVETFPNPETIAIVITADLDNT